MPPSATPFAWLLAQLDPANGVWLLQRIDAMVAAGIANSAGRRALGVAYAQIARRIAREPLATTPPARLRADWDPRSWTADQAARVALLVSLPNNDADTLRAAVDDLASRADLQELVALYLALPLLPLPELWRDRACEGLRSNMRAVFDAVALDNPYPSEQLDDDRWNQLVLKACFVGAPCHRIIGLDGRANAELTRMLVQYAAERWAAQRPIPPGLWRCVGQCADAAAMAALTRALTDTDARTQMAATLALQACRHPDAAALIAGRPAPAQDWATLESVPA